MKTRIGELAIFGGPPLFEGPLHVGQPNIGNRERLLQRFNDLLDRRWLTNDGPYVQEFERGICERVGVRHCVAMSSATSALEVAVRAMGLEGEVIVPAFTFVATAHALQWQGITPVFCDVERGRPTLDPRQLEPLITPRTTGILGVHLWGQPCDVEALDAVARRHGLRLLYDAAHAFGCSHKGIPIGRFGDAEVFSFHATKFCNSFEGGALVTNDDELANQARLMRNFGFSDGGQVVSVGTNAKMSEVSAAMGVTSLESADEFIATNRRHYLAYRDELDGLAGVDLMRYDESERCNYQYLVIEIDKQTAGFDCDRLHSLLAAENVLARRYFAPGCHKMEPYRTLFPGIENRLPNTERLAATALSLPTGTGVATADVSAICALVRFALTHADEINTRILTSVAALHPLTQPASRSSPASLPDKVD